MWLRATFLVYMSFFLLIKELPVIFLRYVVRCNMYLRSKDHREAKKHVIYEQDWKSHSNTDKNFPRWNVLRDRTPNSFVSHSD